MAAEVERVCGAREAAGYRRFVEFVTRLYRLEMRGFIDRNLDSPLDLLVARPGPAGRDRRVPAARAQGRRYLGDPRTQRVFSFQAMYAGLSPYDALAIYAVIAYMDSVAGVYFPRGGMHAVPRALAGAAEKHGVADPLRHRREQGRGVRGAGARGDHRRRRTDPGRRRRAQPRPAGGLPRPAARRVHAAAGRRLQYSPSCFLLHVGSRAEYRKIAHHNIHFGRAWRRTFDELIDRRELMSDPSILVTNPSSADPRWPRPAGSRTTCWRRPRISAPGIDWDVIGPRYRDELVACWRRAATSGSATRSRWSAP